MLLSNGHSCSDFRRATPSSTTVRVGERVDTRQCQRPGLAAGRDTLQSHRAQLEAHRRYSGIRRPCRGGSRGYLGIRSSLARWPGGYPSIRALLPQGVIGYSGIRSARPRREERIRGYPKRQRRRAARISGYPIGAIWRLVHILRYLDRPTLTRAPHTRVFDRPDREGGSDTGVCSEAGGRAFRHLPVFERGFGLLLFEPFGFGLQFAGVLRTP
jgi:hypothetical protein